MLVPVYTFKHHTHDHKYTCDYHSSVDIQEFFWHHPHPEGHFGHFGKPWDRIYKAYDDSDDKYYFPILVPKYELSNQANKLLIPQHVQLDIKENRCKILFVCPMEGWEWLYWQNWIADLRKRYRFLTHDNFVVLSGNLSKHPTIKSVYFNFWEKGFNYKNIQDHVLRGTDRIWSDKYRDKKFIFMNRRASPERIGAASLMFKHRDTGYLSLSKTGYFEDYYENALREVFENYPVFLKAYQDNSIEKYLPLKIHDGYDVETVTPCDDEKEDKFYNSYLHITSETFMTNCKHRIFFSEKTFKPILYMQPFVHLNQAHSLKHIRSLGYQTFSPYIDESYDDIEDDEQRIISAINSAEKFINLSTSELHEKMIELLPILLHNISHLYYRVLSMDEPIRVELLKHLKG